MKTRIWTRRQAISAAAGAIGVSLPSGSVIAGSVPSGRMKFRGVVYDVGLRFTPGGPYSVEPFDLGLAKYELHVIANDLSATAVRIEGEDISRLVAASRLAHAAGLTVFFNPWKMGAPVSELPAYYAEAARSAEQLRKEGVDIVFVTGCEMSVFNEGVFPGVALMDRLGWLGEQFTDHGGPSSSSPTALAQRWPLLNAALRTSVRAARAEFHGPVTYASGVWEIVDWSIFDIVGVDYYRQGESPEQYIAGLDRYRVHKPVVVTEVGCCTYVGAAARGGGGFMALAGVNPDGSGRFVGGVVPVRSEREQADYVSGVLELLDRGGVDGAFIYVFSFPTYPTGEGARDLDLVSFSLVKTDPRSRSMPPWTPKEAFYRTAQFYRGYAKATGSEHSPRR